MYDIIIIGAGPAGLTAALYALRANKKVLVIEAKSYGGQIIKANKVENYPGIDTISGIDFATNLFKQVESLGLEMKYETVERVTSDKEVITGNSSYKAKAVIIATGVENRKLNLPKESTLVGKGVSYCATCDGNFFKEKIVAVNGGGNTAIEDALYLSDICKKVYLIHRRDEFRAEAKYLKELKNKNNVEIILNATITNLNGDDHLESITVSCKNKEEDIKVDGLFIAVGQEPKNEIFANACDVNEYGYIITHDEVYTKTPGIYAAGDTRVKVLRQLTTAVSDGSLAATIAIKEMQEK